MIRTHLFPLIPWKVFQLCEKRWILAAFSLIANCELPSFLIASSHFPRNARRPQTLLFSTAFILSPAFFLAIECISFPASFSRTNFDEQLFHGGEQKVHSMTLRKCCFFHLRRWCRDKCGGNRKARNKFPPHVANGFKFESF